MHLQKIKMDLSFCFNQIIYIPWASSNKKYLTFLILFLHLLYNFIGPQPI